MRPIHISVFVAIVGAGCASAPPQHFTAMPSLAPVDAARPLVVFPQQLGQACGRDAVSGAIRDLKRITGVDGFVEVVIDVLGEGDERCARVTAYPYRYGSDTSAPGVQTSESTQPRVVPGRSTPTPDTPSTPDTTGTTGTTETADCATPCEKVASLTETAVTARALAADRCEQRCELPDAEFLSCISDASTEQAADACLATPEASDAPS